MPAQTLIGYSENRGSAWIGRADNFDGKPNHYIGPVPIEDGISRLYNWKPIEVPVKIQINRNQSRIDPDRKAIIASDNFHIFGYFKKSYQTHQPEEWLLESIAPLLSDDLGIASMGLCKERAVPWVEISTPEAIMTPEGVEFRPNIVIATSFDATLSTLFMQMNTLLICDNQIPGGSAFFKSRHSKFSLGRLTTAREALQAVYETGEGFSAGIKELTSQKVTEAQWAQVLEALVPRGETSRSATMSENKREQLNELYRYDERVSPWNGTSFGVLQAFNTWEFHYRPTKGNTDRAERNQLDVINDKIARNDTLVLNALAEIVK